MPGNENNKPDEKSPTCRFVQGRVRQPFLETLRRGENMHKGVYPPRKSGLTLWMLCRWAW